MFQTKYETMIDSYKRKLGKYIDFFSYHGNTNMEKVITIK